MNEPCKAPKEYIAFCYCKINWYTWAFGKNKCGNTKQQEVDTWNTLHGDLFEINLEEWNAPEITERIVEEYKKQELDKFACACGKPKNYKCIMHRPV